MSSYSATPVLEHVRLRRWRRVTAIALLVALAVLAGGPLYRRGKEWRARSLAREAEECLQRGDWRKAASVSEAAYQLAPWEPSALRAVAQVASQAGLPAAYGYWKALIASGQAENRDRVETLRAALRFEQYELAGTQLDLLLAADPNAPETLELASRFAVQAGDRIRALDFARRLLAVRPEDAAAKLSLAHILFASPVASEVAEGKDRLVALSATPGPHNLPALLILASRRDLSSTEALALADAISAHGSATIDHHLTAIGLRIRALPEEREKWLQEAVARYPLPDVETLVPLVRWLAQQGEAARVLALIPPERALTRQDLFLIRADALASTGRWREIQETLEKQPTPLEPFHREIFLARAAMRLGEERGADLHWGRALLTAQQNRKFLLYLGQYAGTVGAANVAEKAYRELSRQPGYARHALAGLLPILENQGRTRDLRAAMAELARLSPSDLAPRNDLAYLDLLLDHDIPAATQVAQDLLRQSPQTLAFRITASLACLKGHDPKAARKLYEEMNLPWEQYPPSAQALYVAALLSDGEKTLAHTRASSILQNSLKPEERRLITPAFE